MLLRCTARLLDLIGGQSPLLVEAPESDEDWYANLIWLQRRKCVLMMHTATLFPVFVAGVRKRDLKHLDAFVAGKVQAALDQEGLPTDALGTLDTHSVKLARTRSRSMLGFLNQAALECRCLTSDLEPANVDEINHWLLRALRNRNGYRQPRELVIERLGQSP